MSIYLLVALLLFAATVLFASVITSWRTALAGVATFEEIPSAQLPMVTLLVPARDEEENIALILQDLHAQTYPRELMQVIVLDDGSTDRTAAIVEGMQRNWPQLQILRSVEPGKKAAITSGVHVAQGELILLTDADVRCGPRRVRSIVAHWVNERSDLIILPARTDGDGVLGQLQEHEQAALLGMGMGTAAVNAPALAYGANLAFARAAFHAVGGYAGDLFASGDDVFLLQRMKRSGRKITALFHADATVVTKAPTTLGGAIQQRLRWAGKMRGIGGATNVSGLLALALPWCLLYLTLTFNIREAIGQHATFTALLIVATWTLWFMPVIALVGVVRKAMGQRSAPLGTLASFIAFCCYAPLIAIASLVVHPQWKGRRI